MICSYHRQHSAMKINKLQYIQYRSISNFEREGQTQQVIYNIIAFRWSLKEGKTQQTIQGWRFIYKTHTHIHVVKLYGKLKQILFSKWRDLWLQRSRHEVSASAAAAKSLQSLSWDADNIVFLDLIGVNHL